MPPLVIVSILGKGGPLSRSNATWGLVVRFIFALFGDACFTRQLKAPDKTSPTATGLTSLIFP